MPYFTNRIHRRKTVIINWLLGPDMEIECEVEVTLYPADPMVMYDRNGEGYPGCDASAEVVDAVVIEDGKRRRMTDEEYGWLEESEAEIEEAAFSQAG